VSLQLNPLQPHIVSLSVAEAKTADLKKNKEQRGREKNGLGELEESRNNREKHIEKGGIAIYSNEDARL